MLLTEKDARTICEKLLSYVTADDASVGVTSENYSHLRFAQNSFTTSGARENVTVGVTVWVNNKRGAASTNEIDDESLKATVAQAEQLAKISPVDREYMPTLGKQTYKPVNAYAEATSNISVTSRAKTINDVIGGLREGKGYRRRLPSSTRIRRRVSHKERQLHLRPFQPRELVDNCSHTRWQQLRILFAKSFRCCETQHRPRCQRGHSQSAGFS